jgi:5-methylcytosine-specific restriction protein A
MSTPIERIRGRRLMRIRARVLSASPMCVLCQAVGRVRAATQVDHIVPIFKGGSDHPIDDSNRQALCDDCHKLKTAEDLEYARRMGCDEKGFPLDPDHPWNKGAA